MAKNNLEWRIEKRKVTSLTPADYNPRKLSEKAKDDLTKSINQFGQVEPVVINTTGIIVGGHQRIKIYTDLGLEDVDVMVPNRKLSKEEEKELNLRLNKNVGEWDWDKMKEFFKIDELIGAGFEDDEVKVWFGLSDAEDVDVDEDRMQILMVMPPESPKLKERVSIKFANKQDYDKVKAWIQDEGSDKAVLALVKMAS